MKKKTKKDNGSELYRTILNQQSMDMRKPIDQLS